MAGNATERSRTRREKSSARRTSLVFAAQQEDTGVKVNTVEELIAWIEAEPETAWRLLQNRQAQIDELRIAQEQKDLKYADETTRLREQLAALEDRANPARPDVEEEYARLRTELEDTRKERDSLMTAMRLMGPGGFSNRTTPTPEDRPRKSTKLPDPPMLNDRKQVTFKGWKSDIRKKLRLNEDHYPTPDHQMAYLKSRCEGKALMHIEPRMQDDTTSPYRSVDEIFDHLESVFDNPDRKRLARNEYARLMMDVKIDFVDFLAEFTRLAEEADQPVDLRKQDLYQKIPTLMQNQTMMDVDDDDVTL